MTKDPKKSARKRLEKEAKKGRLAWPGLRTEEGGKKRPRDVVRDLQGLDARQRKEGFGR